MIRRLVVPLVFNAAAVVCAAAAIGLTELAFYLERKGYL